MEADTMEDEARQEGLSMYVEGKAIWIQDGLTIPVTVTDFRSCFGRHDLLCTPTGGEGTKWVSTFNLKRATV